MRFLIGFVACVSLVIPGAAFGQTVGATTGAINGKVVDPSDAVLARRDGHDLGAADARRADGRDQRRRQLSISRAFRLAPTASPTSCRASRRSSARAFA